MIPQPRRLCLCVLLLLTTPLYAANPRHLAAHLDEPDRR